MKQVRDRFLTFKSTQQCDQIGHFLLLRGVCFWRKSGPKLSKILGKFWNGTTFCQLGRNVFNMEDFLPQVPGHTASQWCLVTLLPNDTWSHCFPMKLHSQAEQDAILKMTNEKNKSIFKKYFLMRQPRPLFVCFCLFKQHKWLLLIPEVRTSDSVMNTT